MTVYNSAHDSTLYDCTVELLESYNDVNSSDIDVLYEEPSPVVFLRYVAKNRPFVIQRGCSDWPAVQKWDIQYLLEAMVDAEVDVAETPLGNADSALTLHDGSAVFVKPFQKKMPFARFMSCLQRSAQPNDTSHNVPRVYYSQAQNDNLRQEYASLFKDVQASISWVDEAFGPNMPLDAANLWLGNDNSVTALHRDNYENIYCQIIGEKHFVLLPPIAAPGVNEQWIKGATYQDDMTFKIDEDGARVPCAMWDPDEPNTQTTPFSRLCQSMRVTIRPGDMLYLPASWYHKVTQSVAECGINCAVNYWYDQSYEGSAVVTNDFIRTLAWSSEARLRTPQEETSEDATT